MARSFQFQQKTQPTAAGPQLFPPFDGWYQQLSTPRVLKFVMTAAVAATTTGVIETLKPQPGNGVAPQTIISEVSFPRSVIYQQKAEPVPFNDLVTDYPDKWFEPFSEPVRTRRLATAEQQFIAFVPGAASITSLATWRSEPLSEPVRFKRALGVQEHQVTASVPFNENITVDKWFAPLSDPVRTRRLSTASQQSVAWSTFTPTTETITEDKWHYPWSDPVRVRNLAASQQRSFFAPDAVTAATAVGPSTLSSEVSFPRSIIYQAQAYLRFLPDPSTFLEGWFQPLSDPVRVRQGLAKQQQQALAWSTFTPAAAVTYFPMVEGDTGLTFQKTIIYQEIAEADSPETHIFWNEPLSEPSVKKLFLSTSQHQSFIWSTFTPAGETIFEDKWHQAWSLPVRTRNLPVSEQRATFAPEATIPTVTAIEPTTLSSEVVFPRSIIYQSLAWYPFTTVEVVTLDKWFEPLSEPVKTRKFPASQQQVFTSGYLSTPSTFIEGWYSPFGEPVRSKRGLGTWEQRDLFWSGFTPTFTGTQVGPTTVSSPVVFPRSFIYQSYAAPVNFTTGTVVTVVLDATETNNDSAQFGVVIYNRAVRANVSIKDVPRADTANVSLEEIPAADTAYTSIKET